MELRAAPLPLPRSRPRKGYRAAKTIDGLLAGWSFASVAFWILYSATTGKFIPFAVYYPIWLGGAGLWIWRRRHAIRDRLRRWTLPTPVKFLVLGFGMVLAEEVVAALANHLTEGLSPVVLVARILQFWALNLFAFFGFIAGWYGLTRYLAFSPREVFYLAGVWGLFAEKVIFALLANPGFFIFDFAPTILTYGLIIMPAIWSQDAGPARWRLHPILRYPLTFGVVFLCSVPAIGLLQVLREHFPFLFPPASLVAL